VRSGARAVKVSKGRFFDLSIELLCVASFEGYFTELNPRWSELLGWTEEELMASPFIELVHPDDRDATLAEAAKLGARSADTVNFENRYLCEDGSYRWLRWNATADPEVGCILAVAHDVTDVHVTREQLVQAREEAERANLAKSQFLANMSHELRTPLNSIIGFTRVLGRERHGPLNEKQRDYLARVQRNGHHLLSLINDILDLSKIEAGKLELDLEEVSIAGVLQSVIHTLEAQASTAGVSLLLDPVDADVRVIADAKRLEQVVLNLAANAVKFTNPGGRVLLRLVDDELGRPARIDIVDTGKGLSAEALTRVFEAFEQASAGASREHSGTGLGLTISRSLARLMGLEVGVASIEGRGCTFAVMLSDDAPGPVHGPILEPSAPAPAARSWTPPHVERPSVVYLVGTDARIGALISRRICAAGHLVVTVSDIDSLLADGAGAPPALVVLGEGVEASLEPFLRPEAAWLGGVPIMACAGSAPNGDPVMVRIFGTGRDLDRHLRELLGPGEDVLIVDDDEDTRLLLREVIGERGATVRTAEDGVAGLAAMAERRPDIVLLDLMMPVMDGFEMLRRMRRDPTLSRVPVLVLTAKTLTAAEASALDASRAAVLSKEALAESTLHETIDHALET